METQLGRVTNNAMCSRNTTGVDSLHLSTLAGKRPIVRAGFSLALSEAP